MDHQHTARLLTITVGSPSLKAVLYRLGTAKSVEVRAAAVRIGGSNSSLRVVDVQDRALHDVSDPLPNHITALTTLFTWIRAQRPDEGLHAIGQRVVRDGSHFSEPTLIIDAVIDTQRSLVSLNAAPLLHALRVIESVRRTYPNVPQLACLDTTVHATIRVRICDGLEYLGLQLDPNRSAVNAPIISSDESRVVVRVIPTDEDLMIARHTHRLIAAGSSANARSSP
jgi:acetate kinase